MGDKLKPDGEGGYDIVDANNSQARLGAGLLAAALLGLVSYLLMGGLGLPIKKLVFLVALVGGYYAGWHFYRVVATVFWLGIVAIVLLIAGLWIFL